MALLTGIDTSSSWLQLLYSNSSSQSDALNQEGASNDVSGKNTKANVAANPNSLLVAENYSANKMQIQYQNQDGDSVSVSMESFQYQSAALSANPNTTNADWKKLVDQIKDVFLSQNSEAIQNLIKSLSPSDSSGVQKSAQRDQVAKVPEYWNA
ncbi:MAG: hypothetical protein PHC61_18220, partial [Chitinivibrionales bacterium]|nr:hypothetical protein [Chitinivibrionales bacterium]